MPEPRSKTLSEATQFYRDEVTKLLKGLDQSGLSVRDQILLFEKMNRMLQQGIKKSLLDQGDAPEEFQRAFGARKPLKDVQRELASTGQGTGQILQKKMLEDLKKSVDLSKKWYETDACFAAGTLVHTKEGLVPIEQIKVGDWVLSKHESGEGERAYKRVVRTFVHEDAELVRFSYGGRDENGRPSWGDGLLATSNHPIWVVGKGWKDIGKVKPGYPKRTMLETIDDVQAGAGGCQTIYATTDASVGWMPESNKGESLYHPGTLYDVSQNKYVMDEEQPQYSKAAWWGEDRGLKGKKPGKEHLYRATVYNIEVEDFQTYYVGTRGVWVHNKNLQINVQGGVGLTARVYPTVFHTRAELLAYLRKNASSVPGDSIFIIRSQHESQYLWRGELQPRSAKFEDKVQSRLYKQAQNSKGEMRQKTFQAVSLQEEIPLAGRNALRDGNALGQMNVFQRIKTYGVFQAEAAAKGLSGNAAYKQIIDDAVENTKFKGCFVAGTLVHTKEGLKPIEQICVGDYVLSKPESGKGKVGYKKVLKTFEYEDKEVWYVEFLLMGKKRHAEERRTGFVVSTGNHPFWVTGRAELSGETGGFALVKDAAPHWLRADELEPHAVLELADGRHAWVSSVLHLAAMSHTEMGWLQGDCAEDWQSYNDGRVVSFAGTSPTTDLSYPAPLVLNDVERTPDGDYPILTRNVYNLEVEGHHTYFVGELGVWVHNQNCGELSQQHTA